MTDNCWIYRGDRKEETYLFVAGDGDFSRVPESLLASLGELRFVMSLRLNADRKLARADVTRVMRDLDEQGFYLQLPPPSEPLPG